MQKEVVGVDVGGTKMKSAVVSNGEVLQTATVNVGFDDSEQEALQKLYDSIAKVISPKIEAIGIGVPSVVDVSTGIVYDTQNIPSWTQVPLKKLVEEKFNIPVYINNDVNCFALGEKQFGKMVAYANGTAISLGTGIGMGIIINHRLYNGYLCGAGEIGMLPYQEGIVEDYVSSFWFEKKYSFSAKDFYERALKNDQFAKDVFQTFGEHLGEAIKIVLYTYAPEIIVLGGSISHAFFFFEKSMKQTMESFVYKHQLENINIVLSSLKNAPILGAASLCFNK